MYKISYKLIIILGILAVFFTFTAGSVPVQKKISLEQTGSVPLIPISERSSFYVTSGTPSFKPVKTNYGFVSVEDDRFLSGYSQNGQNLWLTHIGKIKSFTVNESDFIFIVTQSGDIVLVNPSGRILWRKYSGFVPSYSPLCTTEGRFYVFSEDTLSCYGIGSVFKWSHSVQKLSKIEPVLLNDQSILLFIENDNGLCNSAVRFSMYGECFEKIDFKWNIIKCFSFSDKIIIVYENGNIEAFSTQISNLNKNILISLWKNENIQFTSETEILNSDSEDLIFITPRSDIVFLDKKGGIFLKKISIPEINQNIQIFERFDEDFAIMDDRFCFIYSSDGILKNRFSIDLIKSKYPWKYALLMKNGILQFFSDDWTINVFDFLSSDSEEIVYDNSFSNVTQYRDFISFDYQSDAVISDFSKYENNSLQSDYGTDEIEMTKYCLSVIDNQLNQSLILQRNFSNSNDVINEFSPSYYDSFFKTCALLQNSTLTNKFIEIINSETDMSVLAKALEAAAIYPYDPNGKMLEALENLVRRINPKEKLVLKNTACLVCEISLFMGKPAFCSRGKQILSYLFRPQYDVKIKQFVRSLYQKLADTK